MTPVIQFNQAQSYEQFQKSALNQAKKELGALRVGIEEYAQQNDIKKSDAKELDLNNDDKISIWERASEIIAKEKLVNSQALFAPSMLVNFVYQVATDFAQQEYDYLKSLNEAPQQRERVQHLV